MIELVHKKNIKTLTRLWLHLLRKYFRIEVEGLEHLPKSGGALVVPNHSGFAGADAVLLTFLIKRETRRRARILAHRAFFDLSQSLKEVSESFGLKKAAIHSGVEILKRGQILIIFPEGESGNFKPTLQRYELQKFHTGFLRMAIEARTPIVPCLILGAEESHLNLGNLNFSEFVKGLRIPLPLNFMPLPAKWRIVFLPPIPSETFAEKDLKDPRKLKKAAADLQRSMQKEIRARARKREYVYFERTRAVADMVQKSYGKALKTLRKKLR